MNGMDSTTFGTGGGNFETCPAGQDVIVLADGMDLGYKVDEFKDDKKDSPTYGQMVKRLVRKYALVFQTTKTDTQGRRFTIVREFTASMAKTANLRKFVDAWNGSQMTEEQAKAFDPTSLYARCGLGSIINKTSGAGKLRAEVQQIVPLFPGIPAIQIEGYERPKFLQMRKDDYARDAAAFTAQQTSRAAAPARTPQQAVDAMVNGTETDDLPF